MCSVLFDVTKLRKYRASACSASYFKQGASNLAIHFGNNNSNRTKTDCLGWKHSIGIAWAVNQTITISFKEIARTYGLFLLFSLLLNKLINSIKYQNKPKMCRLWKNFKKYYHLTFWIYVKNQINCLFSERIPWLLITFKGMVKLEIVVLCF